MLNSLLTNNASIAQVWKIPVEGWSIERLDQEMERHQTMGHAPFWIVTTNPEILLFARTHADYADTLRQADARTVDGFGLYALLRIFGYAVTRVTGVHLAEHILQGAQTKNQRVGLIGAQGLIVQQTKHVLEQRYPGIVIAAEAGGTVSFSGEDDDQGEEARHRLILFAPEVLLVAFGHPKQERWIARYLADFPTVKVVIGVGGAFDFWSGRIRRAPVWMQRLGIEWFWRLLQEPKRIGRIFRAVIVFPILFLGQHLVDKFRHQR